jgi:hypothetical protein
MHTFQVDAIEKARLQPLPFSYDSVMVVTNTVKEKNPASCLWNILNLEGNEQFSCRHNYQLTKFIIIPGRWLEYFKISCLWRRNK